MFYASAERPGLWRRWAGGRGRPPLQLPLTFRNIQFSKTTVTSSSSNEGALPRIGDVAPDFELPDSTGASKRLSELAASGPLVLLFYRGHW
jgi:hypothetical protein